MKADPSWSNAQKSRPRGAAVGMALLGWMLAAALAPTPARAQDGVTEVEVGCDDNGARCRAIAGVIGLSGNLRGRFLLSFEDATRLTAGSFEFSAEVVAPGELRSRLPPDTFVPAAFPVLVKVTPIHGGRLSFRRNWTLELVTPNLEFSSHTPFRLFRAPDGGPFEDISYSLGAGSFRVRGSGASFSEFVLAADLRPVGRIAGAKLTRLEARLTAAAADIGPAFDDLAGLLGDAREALRAGAVPQAIGSLDAFVDRVEAGSGDEIPDDTVPDDGQTGVAAELLSAVLTLRHSLVLGLQSAQGGMSGFSRRLQVGEHTVDLRFELGGAYAVDVADLEIEGEIVDVNDPALLARLPAGVHVPEEFPVLIRIGTEAGREQAFGGAFEVEIRTDSLQFLGGTPLRLFKAPDGGAFADITRTYGLGSFRVRGSGASFSEFVIAEDMRPIGNVVGRKLQAVGEILDAAAGSVPAAVRQQLRGAVAQVREQVDQGAYGDAIAGVRALVTAIEGLSGESIPGVWRSGEPGGNVAGELVAVLETLTFSLELRQTPAVALPGDVNQDGHVDVGDVFFLIDQVFGDASSAGVLFPPDTDEQR